MNLRSGSRSIAGKKQNILTLRSGRRIHIPEKSTVNNNNKKNKTLLGGSPVVGYKKLWPFTKQSVRQLEKSPPDNAKPSKLHDNFVSRYHRTHPPVTFVTQFIPTFHGGMIVCYGQLKITHTKKNTENLSSIFMTNWLKLDQLLMPEYKKVKKRKKIKLPKSGYLIGLCYNMLLVRDNDPNFTRIWHGHANPSSSATNEHSIIEPVHIPNSLLAYDFISMVSHLPHLQMANHWYQDKFRDSEEKVYSVLDLVFTFQQFISDQNIIQNLSPITRQQIRL